MEQDLVREIIFALQGLPGKIIKPDQDGRFIVAPNYYSIIDPTQRMLLEKIISFGWLVNKIKAYITSINRDSYQGKVCVHFAAALKDELHKHYSLVTEIEQKLQVPHIHNIHVRSLDSYFNLKTLVSLVECCKGKRGGQLACIVYMFTQQGDKQIKAMINRILSQVVVPIRQMLSDWIFHGEIHDPFDEFFICLDDSTSNQSNNQIANNKSYISHSQTEYQLNSLGTNRSVQLHQLPVSASLNSLSTSSSDDRNYIIKHNMMPGFITRSQANKILATGKAIHLLRKLCAESVASSVPGYEDLKRSFESTSIETLFNCGLSSRDEENLFEDLLNQAHKEVSRRALELLFGNFKLKSHFRGLRQYLLLGQGDFIRHLMDLLEPELDKSEQECRFHNIFSVLESAIGSTNAQFDEPDVTNRLDCRLFDATTKNACGWDVFSLVYKIDGPISSIFTEEKMRDYVDIFRQLWRAKRVEHMLTSLWSSQMYYSKRARTNPTVSGTFHHANILLSEMVHFMQHFQDFVMFEVVECSWIELVAAAETANDVDQVSAAHDTYLAKIKFGSLCQTDAKSLKLNAQLNEIFECMLQFKKLMHSLWLEVDNVDKKLIVTENQLNELFEKMTSKRPFMSVITDRWHLEQRRV